MNKQKELIKFFAKIQQGSSKKCKHHGVFQGKCVLCNEKVKL